MLFGLRSGFFSLGIRLSSSYATEGDQLSHGLLGPRTGIRPRDFAARFVHASRACRGTHGFLCRRMDAFQGGDRRVDGATLLLELDEYALDIQGCILLNCPDFAGN